MWRILYLLIVITNLSHILGNLKIVCCISYIFYYMSYKVIIYLGYFYMCTCTFIKSTFIKRLICLFILMLLFYGAEYLEIHSSLYLLLYRD